MDTTEEGLIYAGRLPVLLKVVDQLPHENQLAFVNEKNEAYLRASLLPSELLDIDEHDEINLELRRQELKINLLLDMVGELLLHQTGIPPLMDLKITAQRFECKPAKRIGSTGETIEISIYLTPSIPKALKLYGNIVKLEDDNSTAVEFFGVNHTVQDLLEKNIFRHHRRAIAQGVSAK